MPPKHNPIFTASMACLCLVIGIVFSMALFGCKHEAKTSLLQDIQKRGHLIVGINYGNPPFGQLKAHPHDGYVLEGYDVDLSKAIARQLFPKASEPVRFRQVLTSTRLVAINTHSVDLIAASMSITPNRQTRIAFSKSYFTVHQKLMVPAQSGIHKLRDLEGKTILTINGSTAQNRARKRFPKSRIKGFSSLSEAFQALQEGKGDVLTNDDVLLTGLLHKNCGLQKQFRLLPDALSNEHYGLAFEKSDGQRESDSLRQRIDSILDTLEQDGTLRRLQHQWIETHCP